MKLTAGELVLQYENGFLRWIKAGKDEVLRMIYFAVRDENWGTVPGKIINEQINQEENCFAITYEILFQQDDVKMLWKATIEGNADNSISFIIKGKALSTFKKNRAGFCVLHPIKECSGKKVLIQHTDESIKENIFPRYISPHQPFKNITAMEWRVSDGCKIRLEFKGDIFETEDHRNWTDNNFKTYCTSLADPYPVIMNEGDEVYQKVSVKVDGVFLKYKDQHCVEIKIDDNKLSIPKIGVGRAFERNKNYHAALEVLSAISFNHYRVDIKLSTNSWEQMLQEGFSEAASLKAKLEVALFVGPGCSDKITTFTNAIKRCGNIQQIILLEENAKCISNHLLKELLIILRTSLPNILIGAGTDIYFTEINRSDLDTTFIDFVNYSVNPQVHAYDDASLIENTQGQSATVVSAKNKFSNAVHVSPVTLKMRYNADSTAQKINNVRPFSDDRQQSFFGAIWTLLSLKELCEAGVASITYYETVGERGIMNSDTLQAYPTLQVFELLRLSSYDYFKKSICLPDNINCKSFILGNAKQQTVIIINFSEETVQLKSQIYGSQNFITVLMENKNVTSQKYFKKLPLIWPIYIPTQTIILIECTI
ncbi:MAG TPA: hypothetical protein VGP55_12215 [Chitinophagaceae bacterium]|nr:hypothetical protein [Chitinophagaceae bacterium]